MAVSWEAKYDFHPWFSIFLIVGGPDCGVTVIIFAVTAAEELVAAKLLSGNTDIRIKKYFHINKLGSWESVFCF